MKSQKSNKFKKKNQSEDKSESYKILIILTYSKF